MRLCVKAFPRLAIVLAGIILGQVILYGPSLAGRKILLPLDILAGRDIYLPQTRETEKTVPQNMHLSDLIYALEPFRKFAVSELHAGRLPLWVPGYFAGAPFIWPKFSPLLLPGCLIESPVVLAWSQLLAALVAGAGAYFFLRRVPALSFWPCCIAAWCYPLTGFFIFWQGFPTGLSVYWLPWLLLLVDRTVRSGEWAVGGPRCEVGSAKCEVRRGFAPIGLSLVTCVVLVSGHLDVAGQVLLASGVYALWALYDVYGRRSSSQRGRPISSSVRSDMFSDTASPGDQAPSGAASTWHEGAALSVLASPLPPRRGFLATILTLVFGWALGFLLAAPYILPVLEYTHNGSRMVQRSAGHPERPPIGLKALPETVLPDMYGAYGAMKRGSYRIASDVQNESAAAAYTGLLATLLVAPLAWFSRRHRAMTLFWVCFAIFGLSWCLNILGFVHLLRLPGLNMMSHNRLVFLTAFAVLVMAAVGLEALRQQAVTWRWSLWAPATLLAGLGAWCLYRTIVLPELIRTGLGRAIVQGKSVGWMHDLEGVRQVQDWFTTHYAVGAVLCALGLAGWLVVRLSAKGRFWLFPALAILLPADLLWFARDRSVQSDPALYFPPIPVLQQVAAAAPGRVVGMHCLPADLAIMCGLRDVRGYDGVDPKRFVELLALAGDPRTRTANYALTQRLIPKGEITTGGGTRLSPILDMLSVRYVIFRGSPPAAVRPVFQGPDYWVLTNGAALPRAYIPRRVEVVADSQARLEKLASPEFDPREVAYAETQVNLPPSGLGTVEIVRESPNRLEVQMKMETPGLVVLADLWDPGWQAYLNGRRVPILRVNHAIRGVVVPMGSSTLEFGYEPASFAWGLRLAAFAAAVLLGWTAFAVWQGEMFSAPK